MTKGKWRITLWAIVDQQSNIWEIDNLPNRLTLFRVVLIPIIVGFLYLIKFTVIPEEILKYGILASFFFFIASVTDFFDGYIARKRNIETIIGSFLDPIADKFLVVSSLIMLLSLDRIYDWVVIILVVRELYMTSLRLLASNQNLSVPVNHLGKWKTATQMFGIPFLMIGGVWGNIPFNLLGKVFIIISALLSVISATIYTLGLLKTVQQKRKLKKVK